MLGPRGFTYTRGRRPLVSAGPLSLSLPLGLSGVAVACASDLAFLSGVLPCPLAAVLCGLVLPRLMSRSEKLRQLAVQLASMASVPPGVARRARRTNLNC